MGGFGRRASDGGANLQIYFENWSQPGSHEQIQLVSFIWCSLPSTPIICCYYKLINFNFQVPAECSPPLTQGSQPLTTSVSAISGSGELALSGGSGVLPLNLSTGRSPGLMQLADATSMEELPHDTSSVSKYVFCIPDSCLVCKRQWGWVVQLQQLIGQIGR